VIPFCGSSVDPDQCLTVLVVFGTGAPPMVMVLGC
jgi:hypothetical protein